jgi:selenocysteine lyase/cysteine desulfurase
MNQAVERGIEVELIPYDEHGQTSVAALTDMLDERVKLVCVTHVPTSGGLVNPVEQIGAAVKQESDAIFLVDICQSFGQLEIDVEAMQADFAAITGRKFCRAPRGTGLLYQRAGLSGLVPPKVNDGLGNEWVAPWSVVPKPGARGHEVFEYGFAAKVGFGVALSYANELGLDNIAARVGVLAARLRRQLSSIERVSITDRGQRKCGIVTFTVDGFSTAAVKDHLTERGINSSLANAVASQFDMADRGPDGFVRLSVHYFNTIEELDRVCAAVTELN